MTETDYEPVADAMDSTEYEPVYKKRKILKAKAAFKATLHVLIDKREKEEDKLGVDFFVSNWLKERLNND